MKRLLFVVLVLLLVSGCFVLPQENGLKQLQEIETRYMKGGTLGPTLYDSIETNLQNIELMKTELNALRPEASAGVQEMIDIRLQLLDFVKNHLESEKTRRRINLIEDWCRSDSALKLSLDNLSKAVEKGPAINTRLSDFKKNNPALYSQSNLSVEDFQKYYDSLKSTRDDMQKFYNETCTS